MKKRYEVILDFVRQGHIEVEAESEEEAARLAIEQSDSPNVEFFDDYDREPEINSVDELE